MPPPIPVVIFPYQSSWPQKASEYAANLRTAIGGALVEVHHIGSTAVPGLAAKPIIDLMGLVSSLAEIDTFQLTLEKLGFTWNGELGIPGRRYCSLDNAGVRACQLHLFEIGSPHASRHLAFRDYLRANPSIMKEYEAEKRRARELYPEDSHAYSDEKSDWIRSTEVAALIWYDKCRA